MKPLDKKQIPQFAALCVLSAGLAGYLVMHLVAPAPVSAGTRPANKTAAASPASGTSPAAPGTAAAPGTGAPDAETADGSGDAPPPTPTMHDPFAVGYVDPATIPAGIPGAAGVLGLAAPALPKLPPAGKPGAGDGQVASLGTFGPMPVSVPNAPALPGSLPSAPLLPAAPPLPAAPTWTVTGVLQGAGGKVAVLRSGEARRIVRSGDFVDGTYKVTGVSRTSVTLRHGPAVYQLLLGGAKAAPSAAPAAPALPAAAPSVSALALPRSAAALDSTLIPVYHLSRTHAPLAHLKRQGPALNLAEATPLVPATHTPSMHTPSMHTPAPAKVAKAISLGLRLLDGSVLAPERKE